MDNDSEQPMRQIPTNAEIEALLRDPNRPPPVSEQTPLRVMVPTAVLDEFLEHGLQFRRELFEECESERDELKERLERAIQARADFSDFLKSECGPFIEISLFPAERNWMWEVEQAFESELDDGEDTDDDSLGYGEDDEEPSY